MLASLPVDLREFLCNLQIQRNRKRPAGKEAWEDLQISYKETWDFNFVLHSSRHSVFTHRILHLLFRAVCYDRRGREEGFQCGVLM